MNCITDKTTKYGILAKLISGNAFTVALEHTGRPEYAALYSKLVRVPDMYTRHYNDIMLEFARQTFHHELRSDEFPPHLVVEERYENEAENYITSIGKIREKPLFVNISAGRLRNRWSTENYIVLLALLRDKYGPVILSSAPEDAAKATEVMQSAVAGVSRIHPGNIRALAAIIRRCALVVTPDTSVVHLAVAVGTPVVGLYCESHSEFPQLQWMPQIVPYRAVRTSENTVDAITPHEVFANVCALHDSLLPEQ